jgi:hypothetical protein
MGCPVLGLFNFKYCPTCHCRQKEKQKECDFTSQTTNRIEKSNTNQTTLTTNVMEKAIQYKSALLSLSLSLQ